MDIKSFIILAIISAVFCVGAAEQSLQDRNVSLKSVSETDSVSGPRVLVSSDSARIIRPKRYAVLKGDSVVFEIEPLVETDSVLLRVSHSEDRVDTLGVKTSPPYRVVWRCDSVKDQDQIHLQFGYTLYCNDSLHVISTPMPHSWVLNKGAPGSTHKYSIRETRESDSFKIDGVLHEWNRATTAEVGKLGSFKLLWTSAKLYFAIRVEDNSVETGDFVELHLDLHQDRAAFSGINHRSIRFAPQSRSNSFVVDLTDSGFVLSDSVNVRISREMEWKALVDSTGYTVEASIPFCVISDLEFPPREFGLDVTIMDVDQGRKKPVYASWAGTGQYNRYSPSRWGTGVLTQAYFPLKLTLLIIGAVCLLMVGYFIVQGIVQRRKEEMLEAQEAKALSPLTESVLETIENRLEEPQLKESDVASDLSETTEAVAAALKTDLDCTFDQVLSFRRIKRAQSHMRDPELELKDVALKSGFSDYDSFAAHFEKQMRTSPQVSREAILEEIREEQEEEEEEGAANEKSSDPESDK